MPPTNLTEKLAELLVLLENLWRDRLAVHFRQAERVDFSGFERFDWPVFQGAAASERLSVFEKIAVATALVSHIEPLFFSQKIARFLPTEGDFPEIGGVRGSNFRGILPTGETVVFLLGGSTDLVARLAAQRLFGADHFFSKQKILWLEDMPAGEPAMSGRLVLAAEVLDWLASGQVTRPRFGLHFPAERVETQMTWDDLVLNAATRSQVDEILTWLEHGPRLLTHFGLKKRLKPGYRALFWGPPGTGKTLTAGLIGQQTGRDVYKIDLSMMISKFIGETEKNLAGLFDRAENKDWILFFDEADALFGKRTGVRDAHDKYANQEVSYLLQRVETFGGLVILASNFKSNIDEAFVRRFQSIIHFPMPRASERLLLWEKALPASMRGAGLLLEPLAQKFELNGASILNVVQFVGLQMLRRGHESVGETELLEGIQRELSKEGKV